MDGYVHRGHCSPIAYSHMESGEMKQRQHPVLPRKKRRKRPKPEKSAALANGGSSSSAAESSLTRTSSSSPPSGDADGKGQQQQQHEQGGTGGKRPRLVWTTELHDLFVEAYDSLGDEAVPRRILEKMNEKMNVPEISREKVASHLQKHKLHLRRLAEEASSHSRTKEAPAACHPLRRSLPPNTTPLVAEVSQAAQLELDQQVIQTTPPDCLSRSSSSIAANLQIVHQSIQQQQLFGPPPIKEHVGMETSTAAILIPEANTEEVAVICMVQAAIGENAEEPEEAAPAPAGSILGQFWASPNNEASCTCSWDIFARDVTQ